MGQSLQTSAQVIGLSVALGLVALAWAISLGFAVRYERERDDNCSLARVDAFRALDGSGNTLAKSAQGMARTPLRRLQAGVNSTQVEPRVVSNAVCAEATTASSRLSNLFWVFAQFVDHTISFTPTDPQRTLQLETESGFIPFESSLRNADGQVENHLSCFLDGSAVYGSEGHRAAHLRAMDGSGKLRLGPTGDLPRGLLDLANQLAGGAATAEDLVTAGDERANENVFLTAMHHLWVVEHNRLCDSVGQTMQDDERKFQTARRWNIAQMQAVTFYEFLPLLVGSGQIENYTGYDDSVDPSLSVEFTTAAYRVGHTMVPEVIDVEGRGVGLVESFFNPALYSQLGFRALLAGAARTQMNAVDHQVTDGLRNSLFGTVVHDLAAINLQRGRDHRLGAYVDVLAHAGLPVPQSFSELRMPADVRDRLRAVYSTVGEIELWVGGIAEDHAPGAEVGPLFQSVLSVAFHKLRDGDRFWFENDSFFTADEKQELKRTTMHDILERHGVSSQTTAFVAQ